MDAASAVRLLLGAPAAALPAATFLPIESPSLPWLAQPALAVDGSHAVLADSGAAWVVATRCAVVRWPGPPKEAEPELHAAPVHAVQAQLDAAYAKQGLEAPRAATAAAWAEAWRALREHEAALHAALSAPAGGLLLLDGALDGLPPLAQQMADRVRAVALQGGVRPVGVSKRSALERGGVALVPHLHATGPAGPWRVEVVPGIHVARLHAQAPHAFRVDAQEPAWLGDLPPLCRDAAYVGYPYLLALAHNRAALTAGAVAELKARLALAARREGGARAARLFADFHHVLDRGVPG